MHVSCLSRVESSNEKMGRCKVKDKYSMGDV